MPKNGYTLSFSRKNQDVKGMLQKQQKDGAIISDFVCEAVRFYIRNKDKINNNYNSNNKFNSLDINNLKSLISEQIREEIKIKKLYLLFIIYSRGDINYEVLFNRSIC